MASLLTWRSWTYRGPKFVIEQQKRSHHDRQAVGMEIVDLQEIQICDKTAKEIPSRLPGYWHRDYGPTRDPNA